MSKPRHFVAFDDELNESPFGRFFVDPANGSTFDLSNVRVVHSGVDTVRQLYTGRLNSEVLGLFDEPGIVDFAGYRWATGRVGRDSGYQFRLQNADLGVILLLKSFHHQADAIGPHLKIEVSPHCIASQTPRELQTLMDSLAADVLSASERGQCAVHLALDVQGWEPPADFEARLHCRSRRVRRYDGIESVDFHSSSSVYGRGETYMFGSPGGIQLAVYNKTLEAKAKDRADYWDAVWSRTEGYNPDQRVFRIELRYHHSIVDQFSQGTVNQLTGEVAGFRGYSEVFKHLDGLWQYGLDAFRYLIRPGWFDPFWTLIQAQTFSISSPAYDYRRHYKTAKGFNGKSCELLLGNFITLAARQRMTSRNTWRALKALPFFDVLVEHYELKGKSQSDIRQRVSELLEERYLRWGRAI